MIQLSANYLSLRIYFAFTLLTAGLSYIFFTLRFENSVVHASSNSPHIILGISIISFTFPFFLCHYYFIRLDYFKNFGLLSQSIIECPRGFNKSHDDYKLLNSLHIFDYNLLSQFYTYLTSSRVTSIYDRIKNKLYLYLNFMPLSGLF